MVKIAQRLVSDILAGDGKIFKLFLQCMISSHAFRIGFARGNAAAEFGTPPDHGVVFVDPVDEARRKISLMQMPNGVI
jgi:hypothetical protein